VGLANENPIQTFIIEELTDLVEAVLWNLTESLNVVVF
jgi:hypothetical protein